MEPTTRHTASHELSDTPTTSLKEGGDSITDHIHYLADTVRLAAKLENNERNQILGELALQVETVLGAEGPGDGIEGSAVFISNWRRVMNFRF